MHVGSVCVSLAIEPIAEIHERGHERHDDHLDIECWIGSSQCGSTRIVQLGLLVLDLDSTADHIAPEGLACDGAVDRVHSADRTVDQLHRHSRALDQRSDSGDSEHHVELHTGIGVLVDAGSSLGAVVSVGGHQLINESRDLEPGSRSAVSIASSIVCERLVVLDRSELDHEPTEALSTSNNVDHVPAVSDTGLESALGLARAVDQRSGSADSEVLAGLQRSAEHGIEL